MGLTMKPRSAKNKGVKFQNDVRDLLHTKYPELRKGDIKTAVMGESGVDIVLSPTAKDLIPLDIECKRTETTSVWMWYEQAKENHEEGRVPCVVFRRNRSEAMALLSFEDLLKLMRCECETKKERTN